MKNTNNLSRITPKSRNPNAAWALPPRGRHDLCRRTCSPVAMLVGVGTEGLPYQNPHSNKTSRLRGDAERLTRHSMQRNRPRVGPARSNSLTGTGTAGPAREAVDVARLGSRVSLETHKQCYDHSSLARPRGRARQHTRGRATDAVEHHKFSGSPRRSCARAELGDDRPDARFSVA